MKLLFIVIGTLLSVFLFFGCDFFEDNKEIEDEVDGEYVQTDGSQSIREENIIGDNAPVTFFSTSNADIGNPIELPDTDSVTKIMLGSQTLENRDDIDVIMDIISQAKKVHGNADLLSPFGINILNIFLFGVENDEEVILLKLYLHGIDFESDAQLVFNPFVGLYELSEEKIYKIWQMHSEMGSYD